MKNESSVGIRETRREMSHVLSCLIMAKQLKVLSVNPVSAFSEPVGWIVGAHTDC